MKRLFIITLLLFTIGAVAHEPLPEIREVLKYVETDYNPEAIGDDGASFGILQIQQKAIDDVNRVYGTNYTHKDAFDVICAEEIFDLYVGYWAGKLEKREGRKVTTEDIVRIWNGGPRGYKKNSTKRYYKEYIKESIICNNGDKFEKMLRRKGHWFSNPIVYAYNGCLPI